MERRLKKREQLKLQLPSWWTAEEITPTSEEHVAVDFDYDFDYAEYATQHAAEYATQQSIAEYATQHSIAPAPEPALAPEPAHKV